MKQSVNLIQPHILMAFSGYSKVSTTISTPAVMNITEYSCDSISNGFNNQLDFIPSAFCQWIIGYDKTSKDSSFYCLGASAKGFSHKIKKYPNYLYICFNDDVFYLNKNINADFTPADLKDQIFSYIPEEASYERKLIDSICSGKDFSKHVSAFTEYLAASKNKYIFPENVSKIHDQIKKYDGNISISKLAETSGYSERHINRLFTKYFGYGPKEYCKFLRFQKALGEILKNPMRSNSEFIQNIGYSDQAHFQREFKQFTGETPKQYIKELTLSGLI